MSTLRRTLLLSAILSVCGLCGCFPVELSVSPDGAIVIPRQEGFFVYDPAKGAVKSLYAPKDGKPVFAQYSPDGKQVLLVSTGKGQGMGDGFVAAVMPAGGGEAKQVYAGGNLTYAQWSRDGKSITFTRVADDKVAPLDESLPELILVNPADGASKKVFSNTGVIHRWFGDSKSVLAVQVTEKNKTNGRYVGKIVQVEMPGGTAKPLASLVSENNKMFLQLSPDGTKALFTAVRAGKPDQALDANATGDSQLQELTIATGAIRAIKPKATFAMYSPKGTKVLVGSAGGDGGFTLEVFGADLAKGQTVATDAAANSGGSMDSVDIYPAWLDDNTVLYLRLQAVYGKDCKNFQLVSVDAQGGKPKNHQTVIENNIKD